MIVEIKKEKKVLRSGKNENLVFSAWVLLPARIDGEH